MKGIGIIHGRAILRIKPRKGKYCAYNSYSYRNSQNKMDFVIAMVKRVKYGKSLLQSGGHICV